MAETTKFIPPQKLDTAVLFLVFSRLGPTEQVFEAIRKAQPPRLYIASDGARNNADGEAEKVDAVRNFILSNIDWKCEVKTLLREENLGCKKAVSGAIDWFFENEEMGIILEDDCLPSQSFFWYCEELLDKYKDDTRVMHITGITYAPKNENVENHSYHFARVGGIWGWASWRRAWKLYEPDMESYPQAVKEGLFKDLFIGEPKMLKHYEKCFRRAYGNVRTWDYQWTYTKLINSSLNIMPAKNLIRNIGHGTAEATHTTTDNDRYSTMKLHELTFPLIHPQFIAIDREFNDQNFRYSTHVPLATKIKRRLRCWFSPKRFKRLIKKQ